MTIRWSEEDDELLRSMFREDRPRKEMMEMFGCAESTLYSRAEELKITLPARPTALWKLLLEAAAAFWGPFSEADLAVLAWKRFPIRFGMPGFDHPDSKKVATLLWHKRQGLVPRGLIVRARPGYLTLHKHKLEQSA